MNKRLMIIAGEVSGDLHGASLITELKKLDDAIEIYGIGGDKMKAAGMNIVHHINQMAFLGFAEIIKHLPFIKKVQKDLIELVKTKEIKTVVLIDYPGFNLSVAKKFKSMGIKIIYYISPQIWAWGAGRMKKIKKLVNKMLVVFPFEEELYKKAGVNVEFVGHPLLDRIKDYQFLSKGELYKKFALDESKEILLILPGSRLHEVEKIFPECITAAEKIANEFNLQIVAACSPNIEEKFLQKISGSCNYKIIKGYTYDLMKYAKLGIVKSGTSTMEAGLFGLPMVIVYKTSYLTYLIGKNLIKLNNIGMVNIIAGENIAVELIQGMANSKSIYDECKKILSDSRLLNSIKLKLDGLKKKLGTEGASQRAAKYIYSVLNEA
ncbi:MAG: lipid-A-disaccharide synthase [Ignavibacteriaceae bacterium]|nr:lipid-A-disaccharide synthase [Ignavibacteriaceae bacterium]